MIEIKKVRRWTVNFSRTHEFNNLPFPGMIVMQTVGKKNQISHSWARTTPLEVGGKIIVTIRGRGILQIGNQKYDAVSGTSFIYRDSDPLVRYFYPDDTTAPWQFIWINFWGEAAAQWIKEINNQHGYFFKLATDNMLLPQLLKFKEYAGMTLFISPFEGAALILDLLELLCSTHESVITASHADLMISEIKNELNNTFNERHSTSFLAERLRVTREHLSRTFKRKTGQTLNVYRWDQRLDKAMNLLVKSNLSCKEIAYYCNFGSYCSFYRAFIKKFKQSPESFRQKPL